MRRHLRVNWDNSPDKLGRIESNLYNNWGQVCLEISKNSSGRRFAKVLNECNPYVDCLGQVFGPARRDCNGVCEGTAVHGDINGDSLRDQEDFNLYLNGITDGSLSSNSCRDLNGDGVLNAADLALIQNCLSQTDSVSQSENCSFGPLFNNTESLVKFGIDSISVLDGYADLTIQNLQDEVSAFQFRISGLIPDSVRFLSLADSGEVILKSNPGGSILSVMKGNRIPRNNQAVRFLRVYFDSISGNQLCISSIQVAMSPAQHILANQAGPCKNIPQISRVKSRKSGLICKVVPNPFRTETTLYFPEIKNQSGQLRIFDSQGRLVFSEANMSGNSYLLKNKELPPGLYHFVLQSSELFSGKLLLQP
jgi:hypothetical protein